MSAPIAEVTDVRFAYAVGDDADAGPASLEDLSLRVEPGTTTLLCGGSGSGKTTALRLLNGLVPHFHEGVLSGSVRVGGLEVPETEPWRAGSTSGTVFQHPRHQFFTTRVCTEMAFASENRGDDPADIHRRILATADELGAGHLLDRPVSALSGGELQRAACAAALTAAPPLVLFDEPTANLDQEGVADVAALIGRLRATGHAVVIAEHRLYFLRGLVDDVLVMAAGRCRHRFTGTELFALPEDRLDTMGLRTTRKPVSPPDRPAESGQGGLVVENLRHGFHGRAVLDIEQMAFAPGVVNVLRGVNGAGKTTLARILCGLVEPRRGATIRLDGRTVSTRERLRQGYLVMQDVHRQLFAETVAKELVVGMRPAGAAEVDVDGLLADFGLADLADRHPLSLSGGQKQRLVVASAMACRRRFYIFDEPTSGVDRRHLQAVAGHLQTLADTGVVVIVITHDPELIAACADTITTLPLLDSGDRSEPHLPRKDVRHGR